MNGDENGVSPADVLCERVVNGLYAILDVPDPAGLDPVDLALALLGDRPQGGVDGASVIQLRAKDADTRERVELLRAIAPMCRAAGVAVIVNDDVDAALRAGDAVAGLHLGQNDAGCDDVAELRRELGRPFTIGISTHDPNQLRAACKRAPDYVAYGPVAPTASKRAAEPVVGFRGLLEACRLTTRPLVAIGGLDVTTGPRAIELGANAVATIAALRDQTVAGVRERSRRLALALRRAAEPIPFAEVCRRIPVLEPELIAALAAWSDDVGLLVELGLPARFRPRVHDGTPFYRPCDVEDLIYGLDKRDDEDWGAWRRRMQSSKPSQSSSQLPSLVQIRARPGDRS